MNPFDLPWVKRVLALEPALVRGVIVAVVGLAAYFGLDWAAGGEQVGSVVFGLIAVLAAVQALWTKAAVVPVAKAAAILRSDGQLEAGPAAPQTDGELVLVESPEPHDVSKIDNAEPHPYLED